MAAKLLPWYQSVISHIRTGVYVLFLFLFIDRKVKSDTEGSEWFGSWKNILFSIFKKRVTSSVFEAAEDVRTESFFIGQNDASL